MADQVCNTGPMPNSDISGIGVRVSFYAQAILLALLSTRSPEQAEITDALTTLVVTNLAYSVTTLYLGFTSPSALTLYDALVVVYLLLCSWTAIFFTLPRYNRFRKNDPHVKLLAVFQSYLVFSVILSVFALAPTFGDTPECNMNAKVAIFGPLSALRAGRLLAIVGIGLLALLYTATVVLDYRGTRGEAHQISSVNGISDSRDALKHSQEGSPQGRTSLPMWPARDRAGTRTGPPADTSPALGTTPLCTTARSGGHDAARLLPPGFSSGIDGTVFLTVISIVIVSTLAVVNTELLRFFNHPQPDDSQWGFGQILPMFLIILPLKRTIQAFWTHGLSRRPRTPAERGHRIRVRPRATTFGNTQGGSSMTEFMGMPLPSVMDQAFISSTDAPVYNEV